MIRKNILDKILTSGKSTKIVLKQLDRQQQLYALRQEIIETRDLLNMILEEVNKNINKNMED